MPEPTPEPSPELMPAPTPKPTPEPTPQLTPVGRVQEAIQNLHHALELNVHVANAQNYLDAIQKRQQAPTTSQGGSVS